MEGPQEDAQTDFMTPPRKSKKCFSKSIVTDMPLDLIEDWCNNTKRCKGKGYLKGYTPWLNNEFLVPTHRFDGKQWISWEVHKEQVSQDSVSSLSFYTQNIWFGEKNMKERYANLIQMICESNADFIWLQEVVIPFFEMILENQHIVNNYYISGNTINDYGLLMLSKWPVYFYEFPFENSWMNRSLLLAETMFNGKTFLVWTSHLESLDNRLKRSKQIDYIQNTILKGYDAIFMGDFNFDFKWPDEYVSVDWDTYQDLWRTLKDSKDEDYTMNGTSRFRPAALDHIIISKNSQFIPDFIQRVGNYCWRNFDGDSIHEIREDDIVRTPSDHLGLYAVWKCLNLN